MIHKIANGLLSAAASEQGGELWSLRGADGVEYLWQGDQAYWRDRGIHLFPYVARLTDKSYYLDGALYHMEIHGLAPYQRFRAVEVRAERMVFELTDSPETYRGYPRRFAFRVIYRLLGQTLEITYEVENRDSRTMYFGLGGHPGFHVPLTPGQIFSDYRLRFSEPCRPIRVGFTPECFLSGADSIYPLVDDRILPLEHSLFDDDAVVLKNAARSVTLEAEGEGRSVTVSCPRMPYLGLWHTPGTDAPYLCIEPWTSLPSHQGKITVFESQRDLRSLCPGGCYRNVWTITIAEK